MLRIHGILGWNRIRIRGFMPLTNGSGSFYLSHWPSRCQQKTNFFLKVIVVITLWRYQCCGSMTFWGGSGSGSSDPCLWLMDPDPDPGSGSCYIRHWPSRCQQENNFWTQFFLLITFWSHIYIIFQRLKVKKSHKIVGIKFFLIFLHDDRRIRIRSHTSD